MTTFDETDAAYHTINTTYTYADAFLFGVVPNSVQDQLFAVEDYERRRYQSNTAFRDAYLTPASTEHIADDATEKNMHVLSPQPNTIHDYQPQSLIQRVDNDAVKSVDLGIDHLRGRKPNDDNCDRTAQRYATAAAATGIMAATYTTSASASPPSLRRC